MVNEYSMTTDHITNQHLEAHSTIQRKHFAAPATNQLLLKEE